MNLSDREKRLLLLIVPALLLAVGLRFTVLDDSVPGTVSGTPSAAAISLAEQRNVRLRQMIATLPGREAVMQRVAADLADRESGIIQAETAPQAQAALVQIARRVGTAEQIDIRGGDVQAPKLFGEYGLVYATITFECHVEQLVNFLASLGKQPELIAPVEQRISSANAKEKTIGVRMVLAGVVPKKLVPEKKALGVF
jgi:hypothetical protein